MKVTEQYFPVILLHKMVWSFESVDEILVCDHSDGSYSTEQYFPVVRFMLYKVVRSLESGMDEILKCELSNENYLAILSVVLFIVQDSSKSGRNPQLWSFKWNPLIPCGY